MKRKILFSLIIGMSAIMVACSSGVEKKTFSEKDLETISEKQAEEAIMKVAEQKDGKKKGKEDSEQHQKTFDPNKVGITVENIDPYATNLFELFYMDNNFPKPKENFNLVWRYKTEAYPLDEETGEQREGIWNYELRFVIEPEMYENYENEIIEYLDSKYTFTHQEFMGNTEMIDNYIIQYQMHNPGSFAATPDFELRLIPMRLDEVDCKVTTIYNYGTTIGFTIENGEYQGKEIKIQADKCRKYVDKDFAEGDKVHLKIWNENKRTLTKNMDYGNVYKFIESLEIIN